MNFCIIIINKFTWYKEQEKVAPYKSERPQNHGTWQGIEQQKETEV